MWPDCNLRPTAGQHFVFGERIADCLFLLKQFLGGRHCPKEEGSSADNAKPSPRPASSHPSEPEGPWLPASQPGCRQAPQERTQVPSITGTEEQAPGAWPPPQQLEQDMGAETLFCQSNFSPSGEGVRDADCCPPTPWTGLAGNAEARTEGRREGV